MADKSMVRIVLEGVKQVCLKRAMDKGAQASGFVYFHKVNVDINTIISQGCPYFY
jgi:hypothetical protein